MSFNDPRTLLLILLAAISVFLLIRARGQLARQRQRWATEESPDRDRETVGEADSFPPDDLAQWEVEMHETARRLSAQLDAKLSLLQSLMAEADRAAVRLENALNRAHPSLPPGSQAESLRPGAGHARDIRSEPETPATESNPSTSDDESAPTSVRARRRDEIYRLADYGFDTDEIARRLGSPVGEVELILSLREAKSR